MNVEDFAAKKSRKIKFKRFCFYFVEAISEKTTINIEFGTVELFYF